MVEETEREESDMLPLITKSDICQDVIVDWRLTEAEQMKVHVNESGKNQRDKQDQVYRGRTEMGRDLSCCFVQNKLLNKGERSCRVA